MTDLLETQTRLQAEADALVRLLDLDALLGAFGQPIRVGSSAMGLMVRRDIDMTVICATLDAETLAAFTGLAAQLMQRSTLVGSVRFRNDTGHWNTDTEHYPDGLYLGLTATAPDGAVWTFDIWLVDQPERQPDLAHLRTLLPRLTDDLRVTILEIKHVLAKRPTVPPSALVYEAVMDNDVRSVEQFDAWNGQRSTRV